MSIPQYWHQFTYWITHLSPWYHSIRGVDIWDYRTAFNNYPPTEWRFMYGYFFILFVILVWGLIVLFRRRLHPHYRNMVLGFASTNLILGATLAFFRYQRVPLLGMDALRSLHLLSMIIWLPFILKFRLFKVKKINLEEKVRERKNKYLPKPKESA